MKTLRYIIILTAFTLSSASAIADVTAHGTWNNVTASLSDFDLDYSVNGIPAAELGAGAGPTLQPANHVPSKFGNGMDCAVQAGDTLPRGVRYNANPPGYSPVLNPQGTIEFWYNPDIDPTAPDRPRHCIISSSPYTSGTSWAYHLSMDVAPAGQSWSRMIFYGSHGAGGNGISVGFDPSVLTAGTWHHIAYVWNNSGLSSGNIADLYIDGNLATLSYTEFGGTTSINWQDGQMIWVGTEHHNTESKFGSGGQFDNLVIRDNVQYSGSSYIVPTSEDGESQVITAYSTWNKTTGDISDFNLGYSINTLLDAGSGAGVGPTLLPANHVPSKFGNGMDCAVQAGDTLPRGVRYYANSAGYTPILYPQGTIEFWYNPDYDPAAGDRPHHVIMASSPYTGGAINWSYHLSIEVSPVGTTWSRAIFYGSHGGGGNGISVGFDPSVLTAGTWHHIAYVWNNSGLSSGNIADLYIDGSLATSSYSEFGGTTSIEWQPTQFLWVGTEYNGDAALRGSGGQFDNLVIRNYVEYSGLTYSVPTAEIGQSDGYTLEADLNQDYHVDFKDIYIFAQNWLCSTNPSQIFDEGTVVLVENGQPKAAIVVMPGASQELQDAAADFQTYIQEMSGAVLPIVNSPGGYDNVVLLGRSGLTEALVPDLYNYDLADDGFVIKVLKGKLIITGQEDGYSTGYVERMLPGTCNGIYYFLETLGCRWYMPGDDGVVVPSMSTITASVSDDAIVKPDWRGRNLQSGAAYRMPGTARYEEFQLWKSRIRACFNAYHEGHSLFGFCNADLDLNNDGVRLFDEHPDWFCLVPLTGGQPDYVNGVLGRYDGYAQVCTHDDPAILDFISDRFLSFISNQGLWLSYPLGMNDSWHWCHSASCLAADGPNVVYTDPNQARAYGIATGEYPNITNRILDFANEIADRIAVTRPDVLVTYYALYNIPGLPAGISPRDNVMPVMVAIMPDNIYWEQAVEAWSACSQQLQYFFNNGYRVGLPKFHLVADINWCHANKGIAFVASNNEYSPVMSLNNYLINRALWDVTIDVNSVLDEFYVDFYGDASNSMRLFWETFDDATSDASKLYDYMMEFPSTLTAQIASDCNDYLATAAGQVAGGSVEERRIQQTQRYWQANMLYIDARDAMVTWRNNKTPANEQAARDAIQETIDYIDAVNNEFYLEARKNPLNNYVIELNAG